MSYIFPNVYIEGEKTGADIGDVTLHPSVFVVGGSFDTVWNTVIDADYSGAPTLVLSNFDFAGSDKLDGTTPVVGDRVLILSNPGGTLTSFSSANWGIWVITVATNTTLDLIRSTDYQTGSSVLSYPAIVRDGTAYKNSGWIQTADVVADTGAQVWKMTTAGTGSFTSALPIGSGGTGATTFNNNQPIEYSSSAGTLVSTLTPHATQILDTNNNEVLVLGSTASAVNEVTITNAATAGTPSITATGGDTNVALSIASKGTGVVNVTGSAVNFLGNATAQAAIRLYENTGNGTNYVQFQSPASLAANYTLTWPVDDGTTGQILSTDGSGVLTWRASESKLTFTINAIAVAATSTTATVFARFPWDAAIYNNVSDLNITSARVIYATQNSANRNISFSVGELGNATSFLTTTTPSAVANAIVVGNATLTALPAVDTIVYFFVQKSAGGGTNPTLFSMTLELSV